MPKDDRRKKKTKPSSAKPTIYVIAGPNGAGKTTFSAEFLPHFANCRNFLNADLIAAGLSPFDPESQNVNAGRLLLSNVKLLLKARRTFGLETTLSGRSYVRLFRNAKRRGYRIVFFFLWLPSVSLALSRVENRVKQGGHHVPTNVIRRRYRLGLRNLITVYKPVIDEMWLYDASTMPPTCFAIQRSQAMTIQDSKRLIRFQLDIRKKGSK
jgi:predicted ABC-type ATPase